MKLTTTLREIREHQPRVESWKRLLKYLGKRKADDKPLDLETVLDSNGIEDAIWALRAVSGVDHAARLYACACVKLFLPLYANDRHLHLALEAAEKHAYGQITDEELAILRGTIPDNNAIPAWSLICKDTYKLILPIVNEVAKRVAWDAIVENASDIIFLFPSLTNPTWNKVYCIALKVFEMEFLRLCRLEGEYGEICNHKVGKK